MPPPEPYKGYSRGIVGVTDDSASSRTESESDETGNSSESFNYGHGPCRSGQIRQPVQSLRRPISVRDAGIPPIECRPSLPRHLSRATPRRRVQASGSSHAPVKHQEMRSLNEVVQLRDATQFWKDAYKREATKNIAARKKLADANQAMDRCRREIRHLAHFALSYPMARGILGDSRYPELRPPRARETQGRRCLAAPQLAGVERDGFVGAGFELSPLISPEGCRPSQGENLVAAARGVEELDGRVCGSGSLPPVAVPDSPEWPSPNPLPVSVAVTAVGNAVEEPSPSEQLAVCWATPCVQGVVDHSSLKEITVSGSASPPAVMERHPQSNAPAGAGAEAAAGEPSTYCPRCTSGQAGHESRSPRASRGQAPMRRNTAQASNRSRGTSTPLRSRSRSSRSAEDPGVELSPMRRSGLPLSPPRAPRHAPHPPCRSPHDSASSESCDPSVPAPWSRSKHRRSPRPEFPVGDHAGEAFRVNRTAGRPEPKDRPAHAIRGGVQELSPVRSSGAARAESASVVGRTESCTVMETLASLSPEVAISAIGALLCECQMVVVSKSSHLLRLVVRGLEALMRPLKWPYPTLPVMAACAARLLDSSVPFLVGVLSADHGDGKMPYGRGKLKRGQVLLYADKRKIVYSHPDDAVLMSLPRRRYLLRWLEKSIDHARKGREGAEREDPGLRSENPVGQVNPSNGAVGEMVQATVAAHITKICSATLRHFREITLFDFIETRFPSERERAPRGAAARRPITDLDGRPATSGLGTPASLVGVYGRCNGEGWASAAPTASSIADAWWVSSGVVHANAPVDEVHGGGHLAKSIGAAPRTSPRSPPRDAGSEFDSPSAPRASPPAEELEVGADAEERAMEASVRRHVSDDSFLRFFCRSQAFEVYHSAAQSRGDVAALLDHRGGRG